MPTSNARLRSLTAAISLALALLAAPASAALDGGVADLGNGTAGASVLQSKGKSLSEAVEQVRRQYGGRIISAETQRKGGREVHVIKVLTRDNKVKTVRVPGRGSSRG